MNRLGNGRRGDGGGSESLQRGKFQRQLLQVDVSSPKSGLTVDLSTVKPVLVVLVVVIGDVADLKGVPAVTVVVEGTKALAASLGTDDRMTGACRMAA